jgi:triosephosphate isomerase (TIM)
MVPIVCIGETLVERNCGMLEDVLKEQIFGAYAGVLAADLCRTVIAYEPVWAIGRGDAANIREIQQAHQLVRMLLAEQYGKEIAQSICIQYGGSMNSQNAYSLLSQEDVAGGLVGGAALNASSFVSIVSTATKIVSAKRNKPMNL